MQHKTNDTMVTRRHSMKWRCFKSREAWAVIIWYVVVGSSLSTIPYRSFNYYWNALLVIVFFLYPVFGMVADVFCGRHRIVTAGIWITWAGCISVAMALSLSSPQGAVLVLQSLQQIGVGLFQANALQFGTDQLVAASSEHLSSFVYWYVWIQEVTGQLYNWVTKGVELHVSQSFSQVIMLLVVSTLISILLVSRLSITRQWKFQSPDLGKPYKLIYRVLLFAWKHQIPVRRSALTYWEQGMPSRIDLGKTKYGGPFSNEEVDDVKVFFRISKLLLFLSGFFVCRAGIVYVGSITYLNDSPNQREAVITILTFLSLPLHEVLYPYMRPYYPGILTKIIVGGLVSMISITITLLYVLVGGAYGKCIIANNTIILFLNSWLQLPVGIIGLTGYLVFTTSILEFIVAQSPQSMRGILVGVYYSVGYGIGQGVAWVLNLPFNSKRLSDYLSNEEIYYVMMVAIGLLSMVVFAHAATKHKHRERDEVVNINQFAENYFERNVQSTAA